MLVRSSYLATALAVILLLGTGSTRALPNASAQGDIQGDVTCDSTVNSIDSLQILRSVAGLSTSAVCLADAGDVNCDGAVNSVDSLRILRYVAGLTNTAVDGCTPIGEPLEPEELPPTSEELIAAALAADEIKYEESLWYRALALYDLPGLPEEYRSPVIDWHAGGELSTEIEEDRASLSQDLLDEIAPILERPNDPISIFNNPPQREGLRAPAAVPAGWRRSPAAGGRVYAWIREGPGADNQLASNVAAIERVWNALPGIFRYGLPDTAGVPNVDVNPTSAIDIYFVDFGDVDPRAPACRASPPPAGCALTANGLTAAASPNVGNTWSSYLQISTARQGDDLLDTLAHELGHSGQFAYDAYEPSWLKDATSTWMEFRVLQKLGATQGYTYDRLTEFYAGLHEPLTRDEGLNRYGSWLFLFFASMERGDSVVTSIWQDAARSGKQNEDSIDVVFPFEERFDDFTVRNWNRDPVDPLYSDGDFNTPPRGEPTFPNLKPDLEVDQDYQGAGTHDISENPLALSALYYRYTFGPGVKKVTFTNSVVGNPDAHIWAIPKIRGNWEEPEDWSRDEKHIFCRDTPDQEITEVIIVLSNSDKHQALSGGSKLLMEAETDKCEASITATYHFDDGFHEDWLVTADVQWVEDPDYLFGCNCRVFFPEGTIDWRVELGWESDYSDPPCSEVDSGSIDAGVGLTDPAEQMMILWEDSDYPDDYVLTVGFDIPVTWFSECENGSKTGLPVWNVAPTGWEPDPIIPTIPPFAARTGAAAGAQPLDCDGPIGPLFLVPKDATRFSGSCVDHVDAVSIQRYDWIVEIGQP